jgi:hypothetical protein
VPYAVWYAANMAAGKLRGRGVGIWGVRYRGIQQDLQRLTVPEVCAHQWVHCVTRSLEFASSASSNRCVTVRYESLAADPAALTPLCGMLGLDEPARARMAASLGATMRSQASRWETTFDAPTREKILSIIAPLQARLGYPVA